MAHPHPYRQIQFSIDPLTEFYKCQIPRPLFGFPLALNAVAFVRNLFMPTRPTKPLYPSSNVNLAELKTEDFEPVKAAKLGKGLAKLATLPKKKGKK